MSSTYIIDPENPEYPEGIYQIESQDPVLGGPEGVANRQAIQFVSRTAWLKQELQAVKDAATEQIAAVLEAIPAGVPPGFIGQWSGTLDNIPEGWALCLSLIHISEPTRPY